MDILAVIKLLTGETLEPRGRKTWKPVNCPFHNDRHMSATVNLETQVFVCHGCDIKGDGVALIVKVKKCTHAAAVSIAHSITGATIQDSSEPRERTRLTARPDKLRARRIRDRYHGTP